MKLFGLDLNATRIRALGGADGQPPQPLRLDGDADELPVAISLQGRQPEFGRAGTAILREWPHLACHDFLAFVGKPRQWAAGRHRFDVAKAISFVFERIRPALTSYQGGALVLPGYLTADQGAQVLGIAQQSKLHVLGSITAPLAAGLAAYSQKRWNGAALLIDVDDHALTWTLLRAGWDKLQAADGKTLPHLGLHAWKMCLLNEIAQRCVRHSRRDPRDSGAAEQLLFDQLDDVMDAAAQGKLVEVVARTETWCQNLFLQPEQVREFCLRLTTDAADEIHAAFASAAPEVLSGVWLTALAARIPGLSACIQEVVGEMVPVASLENDDAARMAHELAGQLYHGKLPHVHMDVSVPIPKSGMASGAASFLKIPTFAAEP